MAKFNLGANLASAGMQAGVAEGYEAWSGEFPPTGTYEGVLKILSTGVIGPEAKNAGAAKLFAGVELRNTSGGKYDGFLASSNLNMIESSLPYINQFLLALTDGSDAQFTAIKKAFYETGPTVDERKKHILKIGRLNVNSPNGETPIKVSVKNQPYTRNGVTVQSAQIASFLVNEDGNFKGSNNSGPEQTVVDEETEDEPIEVYAEIEEAEDDGESEAETEEAVDADELLGD